MASKCPASAMTTEDEFTGLLHTCFLRRGPQPLCNVIECMDLSTDLEDAGP